LSVAIRRATPDDVDFLLELMTHEEVDPFLAARRATTREELAEEVERSQREPDKHGRFVVEWDGERAGTMGFSVANERSRIAHLSGLAIHPDFRGRRISDEAARQLQRHLIFDLGYHRLQLEVYGFNERALRHAERAGYVREGVKRKAYWRHGEWVDGVLFGLIREDLDQSNEEELMEPDDEARIQDTAQEYEDELGGAEGMQERPDESREKDERRGDS
jgi:RimJ/RimL family protein N-acetyltransferase